LLQGKLTQAFLQYLLLDLDIVRPGICDATLETPDILCLQTGTQTNHQNHECGKT
jgi:hypothetical protein